MVANRDEALRALAIAQRHLDSDNYDSAIRFATKSIQLEPTPEARKLLDRAQRLRDGGSSSSASAAASSSATSARPSAASTSQRTTTSSSSTGAKPAPAAAEEPAQAAPKQYTSAQLAVVKRVRACRTTSYYEILELEKSCSDGQVKKAYRKLALSLHPDKNLAPGAEDAFKMVSKAFQVLSDSNKRAIYDQTGSDPDSRGGGGGGGGGGGFARSPFAGAGGGQYGGADDISPEDLFRAFFGGGGGGFGGGGPFGGGGGFQSFGGGGPFGGTTFQFYGPGMGRPQQQRRPGQGGGAGRGQQQQSSPWVQLAPLLLFFALSLLSQLPSWLSSASSAAPDPSFAFEPRARHGLARDTLSGTRYYVDADEWSQHPLFDDVLTENADVVERVVTGAGASEGAGAAGAPVGAFSSSAEPGTKRWKRDLAAHLSSPTSATAAPVAESSSPSSSSPSPSSTSPDADADPAAPLPPVQLRTPHSLLGFERRVNEAWVARLQNLCRMELNRRTDGLDRARGFLGLGADHARIKEILDTKLPNCEALSKIPGYRVQY
ncbi:hypothetical protein JCM3775_006440 [Rhodotorula graminis]|uniref:J domain-containing protein n=1 Tax=Rhodotorula graminis (strain WP1) TaxID=578459 RepID=A0A0P9F7W4_RHOGW|nr:uncharacterized protein RHOBADRAFT_56394 [Rhodotorula graminis WP1]KPV71774.1 hypothetical protein RHOBADRAFT_56394 [Rhodotorula graminis WP1]